MPSAMPERRRSLARRVALASALAAGLGGAVAAFSAGMVASGLITRHDEDLQIEAVEKLAEETLEELEEETDDDGRPRARPSLEQALAHGLDDLDIAGVRGAIHEGERVVAGDRALPFVRGGACEDFDDAGAALRVCALDERGATYVVAISAARAERERTLVAWAVLIGILVGAVSAGLVSGAVAHFSLGPLSELRDRVRRVSPDAPDTSVLEPKAAHAEIEELRVAVRDLVRRLGDSLAHARHFAAQAAHELRTPLATLSGELELLAEEAGDEGRALARIRDDVASLTTLVERLLVLASPARLEAGEGEAVELGDVVTEVIDRLDAERRTRVQLALDEDVFVRGDAALLRALVANAVDNAIKFSNDAVRVSARVDAERVCLDVVDDGPGIPEEDRVRVFAPFFRSASARASGASGYGIGLALIAHVAEVHGGAASIEPSARGLHLRVSLPPWRAT